MASEFTENIVRAMASIPEGKVTTYGSIAALAGNPRGARQVVRILNTRSRTDNLPWHRVIRRDGCIALPPGGGFELQKSLLEAENVEVSPDGRVNLAHYGWMTE